MPSASPATIFDAPHPVLCFQALGNEPKIDAEKGIMRGVSVMSKGPALGHSLEVDDTTLDQIVRQGNQRDRVPVYVYHGSGLKEHVGDAVNFSRDGDKARCDIELYDSHADRAYLLEKAQKNPTSFGISSESYPPPNDPLHVLKSPNSKVRYIRSTKLDALAFVRDPATNTSLFSIQPNPDDLDSMTEEKLAEILGTALKPVNEKLTALETENKALKTTLSALPTEEQRKLDLEAAATAATTKFAASCGIKPGQVPVATGEGKTTPDPEKAKEKTEFERLMDAEKAAGSPNPQVSARWKNPAAFNAHMALQTGKDKPGRY